MQVHLLHPDRDVALLHDDRGHAKLAASLPVNADELVQDLQLDPLFAVMSAGEDLPDRVARTLVLNGLTDPDVAGYRQQVLRDCIGHPQVIADLYQLACDAVADQKGVYRTAVRSRSESRLSSAAQLLGLLLTRLRALREICEQGTSAPSENQPSRSGFTSPGFIRFFAQVRDELDDEYLNRVDRLVDGLNFRNGLLTSGALGEGSQGSGYLLRRPDPRRQGLFRRVPLDGKTHAFTLPAQDEASAVALGELRDRVLRAVSREANEAVDHVLAYFETLQHELAFYVGCVRLHTALTERHCPLGMPTPGPVSSPQWSAADLVDPCLLLHWDVDVVGNGFDADGKELVLVTGANGGGKSTLLRAIGVATLMMRCGMFVPANDFSGPLAGNVFTHFRREEDASMEKGKFDEELSRMSDVAQKIRAGDLLLCNESFSSTNELEGSQIGVEVLTALADSGVRVVMVTHMFDLANTLHRDRGDNTVFLEAERGTHGVRTFKLRPGLPSQTSHAIDLFDRIVADPRDPDAPNTPETGGSPRDPHQLSGA